METCPVGQRVNWNVMFQKISIGPLPQLRVFFDWPFPSPGDSSFGSYCLLKCLRSTPLTTCNNHLGVGMDSFWNCTILFCGLPGLRDRVKFCGVTFTSASSGLLWNDKAKSNYGPGKWEEIETVQYVEEPEKRCKTCMHQY